MGRTCTTIHYKIRDAYAHGTDVPNHEGHGGEAARGQGPEDPEEQGHELGTLGVPRDFDIDSSHYVETASVRIRSICFVSYLVQPILFCLEIFLKRVDFCLLYLGCKARENLISMFVIKVSAYVLSLAFEFVLRVMGMN